MTNDNEQIKFISFTEAASLAEAVCGEEKIHFPLTLSNKKALIQYFSDTYRSETSYLIANYQHGEKIVESGKIIGDTFNLPDFSYTQVPLGIILQGEVIIIKGGKATKKLNEGDFIGLFETSDWLVTGQNRNIGDWTLIANSQTQILYFSAISLQKEGSSALDFRDYLVSAARLDMVPQPLTDLPLLDWTASHTTRSRLNDYVIIAHTHLLPNNFPFFRHLAHLVGFGRMYVLEKPYSTIPKVRDDLVKSSCEVVQVRMEPGMPYEFSVQKSIEILWSKVIEEQHKSGFTKILIIDDGGDLWTSIPWDKLEGVSLTGVEQTQRGITRITGSSYHIPPIVSVASSGIKKNVESQFIGKSIVDRLQELELINSRSIGIIGTGSIGTAIINTLKELGHQPYYYDTNSQGQIHNDPYSRPSLDSLINDSDIIISTTGSDALKGVAFERIFGKKIVASTSSADVEFMSILKLAQPTDKPFNTRHVQIHENLEFEILNGGYPLNFNRVNDATKSEDIVLTRCLMYVGAMEAIQILEDGISGNNGGESEIHDCLNNGDQIVKNEKSDELIYALDPISQKNILEKWITGKLNTGVVSPVSLEEVEGIVNQTTEGHRVVDSVWSE